MDIAQAIVRILKADAELKTLATGGIWRNVADRKALPPYIIVTAVSGTTEHSHDASQVRSGTVDVKGITQEDKLTAAQEIRDRADTVLAAASDYGIQSLLRDGEIDYTEWDGDHRYNHLGYQYRYLHFGLTDS